MGPGNRGAVPDRSEVFVDKTGDGHLRVAYINRYVYAKKHRLNSSLTYLAVYTVVNSRHLVPIQCLTSDWMPARATFTS